jgi:tRNA(Ile)-lysidine synthase
VLKTVRAYIRDRGLIRPGERVLAAVSGGADSVALLRVLLELRDELGIVLSVAHLNHQLRGAAADEDARFVAELAASHGLEFHLAVRDVRAWAAERKLTLEAAGRELRYGFFRQLIDQNRADKVATGHTLDDQAETVLLKVLRGSWLRGLGGIHDRLNTEDGRASAPADAKSASAGSPWVVRPLLGVTRRQIEAYLRGLSQAWRDDASNRDLRFTRNRVRKLISLLQDEFNPAIAPALAQMAELAQAEESYWAQVLAELAPGMLRPAGEEAVEVDPSRVAALPVALQRRLLRLAGERLRLKLGFDEVERLRRLLTAKSGSRCVLLAGWEARMQRTARDGMILRIGRAAGEAVAAGYEYRLGIPGEVIVPEAGCVVRASLVEAGQEPNVAGLADAQRLGPELTVRNWRPGDRYLPRGKEHENKLKVYFQQYRIPPEKRTLWPLAFRDSQLVWALGMPIALGFEFKQNTGAAVRIEGVTFAPRQASKVPGTPVRKVE